MPQQEELPNLVSSARRRLGADLTCGPLAFGCWRFAGKSPAEAQELIETALDLGMDLIDTADIYGRGWDGSGFGTAEELLGQVLRASPGLRDRMIIATKGGIRPGVPYDSSAHYLITACEASMERLGVDVVDLYQVHRPDLLAHPAETAEALDLLVKHGRVRAIGVSNFTPAQTRALQAHLSTPIVSTQPELSAAHLAPLRDGTADLAMEAGHAVLAWSPLAGGRLAGGGQSGEGIPPDLIEVLDDLVLREDVPRATLALAFVLALPFKPVAILGTQTIQRLQGAVRALDVHLDRRDCYRIIEASEGVALP